MHCLSAHKQTKPNYLYPIPPIASPFEDLIVYCVGPLPSVKSWTLVFAYSYVSVHTFSRGIPALHNHY